MNGWLLVDKPDGVSSHDVVQSARGWLRQRRVGHTGTLDPLATGLLVLCLGAATRLSEYLLGQSKEYRAVVRLGQTTDTYDADGEVTATLPVKVGLSEVTAALHQFRGEIEQTPPAFSAIKSAGQRAYKLAREGKAVWLPARSVRIEQLSVIDFEAPDVTLELACSAGTYVRSLAHDLGQALGCGAHLAALRRTIVGPFSLRQAHSTEELEEAFCAGRGEHHVLSPGAALGGWPEIRLQGEDVRSLRHGNPVTVAGRIPYGLGLAYDSRGELIAVVEGQPAAGQWHPRKVLAPV
jgi:tRNA pseudouridine55 synthase